MRVGPPARSRAAKFYRHTLRCEHENCDERPAATVTLSKPASQSGGPPDALIGWACPVCAHWLEYLGATEAEGGTDG